MKITSLRSSNTFGHRLAFAAVGGLLAVASSLAAHAANLVLTGSTTANCTYSSAGIDSAGTLTVATTSNCILTPDSLAFASTPATVLAGGSVSISVTRANPVNPAGVSGTVTATGTGGCTVSGLGNVGFTGTSTAPAAVTISAATVGTCTVSLSAGAGANLGTPNTFTLTASSTPPPPPDVLAFSGVPTSVQTSGTATVSVTRTGVNTTAGVSGTVTSTGGCSISGGGVVSFPTTTTTPVALTITAPAAASSCVVTLTTGAGANAGTPSSFTLAVNAPPPPPPTVGGCSTSADVNADIRLSNRAQVGASAGQSAAVKFYAPGDARYGGTLLTSHTTTYSLPPQTQINVSECPGNFTNTLGEGCSDLAYGESTNTKWIRFSYPGACNIDPNKTYYLNIRFPGCTGTCGVFVDLM